MHFRFDAPREPEERDGDQDGADVGEREAEFRAGLGAVRGGEGPVDRVDARDEKPDCGEEAETRAEVEEADFFGGEAVDARVDVLHVRVDGVGGAEEEGLVDAHDGDDGLGEDLGGPREGMREFLAQRARVFAGELVVWGVGVGGRLGFEAALQAGKDHGGVGLAQEEVPRERVHHAYDGHDPEDPPPAEPLDDEAAEQRAERGT